MSKKKIIIAIIPIFAIVIAYLLGTISFNGKFLPNTYINEKNIGGMTVDEVNEDLKTTAASGEIVLTKKDDKTESILLSDIDYFARYSSDISEIQNQQTPFSWLFSYFKESEYNVPITASYNEEKLNSQVKKLKCITNEAIQDPVNAKIERTDAGFVVVDAIDGNRLNEDKLIKTITEKINSGCFEINLVDENCYLKAEISSNDPSIAAQMEKIQKFNDLIIKIDMQSAEEVIDFSVFSQWLSIKDNEVVFDEDKVYSFVSGLSNKYNTYGTKRNFTTTKAGVKEVGGGDYDTYGFQLDVEETNNTLLAALKQGKSKTIEAVWSIVALCRNTPNGDIGNTYVEIDLTTQHLWYYEDGDVKYSTDIVSGLDNSERRTPTGVFRVWHKETDATLKGEDYETPVKYWMPFTWTGCGMHDATWQPYFGGDRYKTNGSHGCINMPYDAAEALFGMIEYDTPVIVYNS